MKRFLDKIGNVFGLQPEFLIGGIVHSETT